MSHTVSGFLTRLLALAVLPLLVPSPATAQLITGPAQAFSATAMGTGYGRQVRPAGDVNGDGYQDVLVAESKSSSGAVPGSARLIYGGPGGLGTGPAEWTYVAPDSVAAVAGVGDVNADGYDDFLVGMPFYDDPVTAKTDTGRVVLFLGSASGPSASPAWAFQSGFGDNLTGFALAGIGDVNGDGYDDFLIGAPNYNPPPFTHQGAVFLFLGSPNVASITSAHEYDGNGTNALFGFALCGRGDVNGDGLPDFAIGSPSLTSGAPFKGRVSVYHGSGTGLPSTPAKTISNVGLLNGAFGWALAFCDVNRDGVDDLLVGAPASAGEGAVYLFDGSPGGVFMTPSWEEDGNATGFFGGALAAVQDIDGDGYDDFLVGDYLYPGDGTGRAILYRGSAQGPKGDDQDPQGPVWVGLGDLMAPYFSFGEDVCAVDGNDDGVPELLIGAPSGAVLGQVLVFVHDVSNPQWPGSGADFRLLTSIGPDSVPNVIDEKPIKPGDTLKVALESPHGALVGKTVWLAAEVHLTGAWAGPVPGLFQPELQLNVNSPLFFLSLITVPALPANGVTFTLPITPDPLLFGLTLRLQGLSPDKNAPNHKFHATDAHALDFTSAAIYVDPLNGDDGDPGTDPGHPVQTLDVAVQAAKALSSGNIYPEIRLAANAPLNTGVVVDAPISIRGGYDPVTWVQQPGARSVIQTGNDGLLFKGIATFARIESVEFRSADGQVSYGAPSIAVRAKDCASALQFSDCKFVPGKGKDGMSVTEVYLAGGDGVSGHLYHAGDGDSPHGGDGGAGGGGDPGELDGHSGHPGYDAQGLTVSNGGAGGLDNGAGMPGGDGAAGSAGTPGHPDQVDGLIVSETWLAGSATAGGNGVAGNGGGGGGGGSAPAPFVPVGGYGGGGGAGGYAGHGNAGGGNGGGSFGVLLIDASPKFLSCTFAPGAGGHGGDGGAGSAGGNGGQGDTGGTGFLAADGGDGGHGGHGGGGAGGGGGSGGSAYGVFRSGSSTVHLTNAQYMPGVAGQAGLGGANGWDPSSFAPNGLAGTVALAGP